MAHVPSFKETLQVEETCNRTRWARWRAIYLKNGKWRFDQEKSHEVIVRQRSDLESEGGCSHRKSEFTKTIGDAKSLTSHALNMSTREEREWDGQQWKNEYGRNETRSGKRGLHMRETRGTRMEQKRHKRVGEVSRPTEHPLVEMEKKSEATHRAGKKGRDLSRIREGVGACEHQKGSAHWLQDEKKKDKGGGDEEQKEVTWLQDKEMLPFLWSRQHRMTRRAHCRAQKNGEQRVEGKKRVRECDTSEWGVRCWEMTTQTEIEVRVTTHSQLRTRWVFNPYLVSEQSVFDQPATAEETAEIGYFWWGGQLSAMNALRN